MKKVLILSGTALVGVALAFTLVSRDTANMHISLWQRLNNVAQVVLSVNVINPNVPAPSPPPNGGGGGGGGGGGSIISPSSTVEPIITGAPVTNPSPTPQVPTNVSTQLTVQQLSTKPKAQPKLGTASKAKTSRKGRPVKSTVSVPKLRLPNVIQIVRSSAHKTASTFGRLGRLLLGAVSSRDWF